jgi:aspartokinase/homoserine dehydrogenase 1
VILDCSASDEVAELYPRWLGGGIHVVTPNKRANSGRWRDSTRARGPARGGLPLPVRSDGRGRLPIIQTLRDLRETGDEIRRIEGILSGTLAYLSTSGTGSSRSRPSCVMQGNGYTEPDPRDDLSGTDVARKLVILGGRWACAWNCRT